MASKKYPVEFRDPTVQLALNSDKSLQKMNGWMEYDDEIFTNLSLDEQILRNVSFDYCTFKNCSFNKTVFENCIFTESTFESSISH